MPPLLGYRCCGEAKLVGARPPSDWAGVRDRWQIAHLLRTISAMAAFDFLAAATTARHHGRQGVADTTSYAADL